MGKPTIGSTLDTILRNFRELSNQQAGIRIVEAAVIGSALRFRNQVSGKLGVVVGEIGISDATPAQISELEDAIELGQVEVLSMPLYVSGRPRQGIVLHQATGIPLDENSDAARQQRARLARAYG